MPRKVLAIVAILGLLAAAGTTAHALINPNFTPAHLVAQSDLILALKIKPPAEDSGRCAVEIVRCIKGRMPAGTQVLDLSRAVNHEHAKAIRQMIADPQGEPALLFVGRGEKGEPSALLHIGGKWIALRAAAAAAPPPRN
jgi:hypothetical protein